MSPRSIDGIRPIHTNPLNTPNTYNTRTELTQSRAHRDILADPLVERHRYLLLHPLPPNAQEAEGEMLPTIKVASDKEGVKTIALPGPAYDDEAYVFIFIHFTCLVCLPDWK